jgi:cytochrome c oxidase subunit III
MNEITSMAVPSAGEAPRDATGAKLGMWLFLLSEILLFGGLFILYSAYRYRFASDFHQASREMEVMLGTLNTFLLQTSALSMTLSIWALRRGNRRRSAYLLIGTMVLGLLFLGIKAEEWLAHIEGGIYPQSAVLLARPKGEIIFFSLYYAMTGLHGLHVLIGLCALTLMLVFLLKGKINASRFVPLENTGLYWHLVDIIWIFLYPLFYLIT